MPSLYAKPDPFKPGRRLSASGLNQIVSAVARQIKGDGTITTGYYGDRITITANDQGVEKVNHPSVSLNVSLYVVLKEFADYLLCAPYFPSASVKGSDSGETIDPPIYREGLMGAWYDTTGQNILTTVIAKPYILQQSPWNYNQSATTTYDSVFVDGADPNKISTGTYAFTDADIGKTIYVFGDAGWNANNYQIVDVDSGAAILDGSPAPVGSSGGSFYFVINQPDPVSEATVDVYYVYTDVGTRQVYLSDGMGGLSTLLRTESIVVNYFAGDIIAAGANFFPLNGPYGDPVQWMDLNAAGRKWEQGMTTTSSSIITSEWQTSEILIINPTSKIQFDIGIDGSQGLLTNIGGGVARYRPWSLTVVDLIPTTEVRTTTLQFGTNFYISEPGSNTTRVDFGLTVNDLIPNTVTKAQHLIFGAGFTVATNGGTGTATITFSGSAYSLTVQDEGSWIAPLTGVGATFPQTPTDSGHSLVSVGGCTDLQALYPLFVLQDGSVATTAHLHILCAEQLYSGYVDHGENNSGVQDFAGAKNFHNPTLGTSDPDNYVTVNGFSNVNYGPNFNSGPSILFTNKGSFGGSTSVVNGGGVVYASIASNSAFLSLVCENENTDSNYLYVQAGPNRTVTTDSDSLQGNVIGVQGPFWTTWHTGLGSLCKTWSNNYGTLYQPDDEEANNTYFSGAGNVFYPVVNNACTFVFIGGLFRQGYWSRPFTPNPTMVAGSPVWDWGTWYLLGQQSPTQANAIDWMPVNAGIPYDPGYWASNFGGGQTDIRNLLGLAQTVNIGATGPGVTGPSASPRPATDFIQLGQCMDLVLDAFVEQTVGGVPKTGTGSGISHYTTHTIPLAQLTPTGSQGSITIRNGMIINYQDPT